MLFSFDQNRLPNAAHPDHAERTIDRWTSNSPDTDFCNSIVNDPAGKKLLYAVAGNSPFLAQCLQRDAVFACELLAKGPDAAFDKIVLALKNSMNAEDDTNKLMGFLRETKRNAALTIAVGDISEVWDVDKVMRALSTFADESLSLGVRHVLRMHAKARRLALVDEDDPEVGSGYVVLALGKLGARELNYSSDVDLIVLYDPDKVEVENKETLGPVFVRATRDLVRIMEERTEDGYVHRTDLRLRPDPGTTPVAISTIAAETYYESVGQNWERMAMIRARPVAGDIELGEDFLHHLRPFVWRNNLDFAAIQDIHSVKRQINAHRGGHTLAVNGHNIKLGRGGIREIEFFTQTQQLIWGGRNPELRGRELYGVLDTLVEHGRVAAETAGQLKEAYGFLRRIEHRLQMVDDKQTHEMPKTNDKVEEIAIFSGYDDATSFGKALLDRLHCVEQHYGNLFGDSKDLGGKGSLVFTGNELHPDTQATLEGMGYTDPSKIFNTVRIWHHGRYRATRSERSRQLLTELMPQLLHSLASTANPGFAFAKFDEFLSRLPAGVQLLSLLHANPNLLDLVAMVMGNAPLLADWLSRNPHLLDYVLSDEFDRPIEDGETMETDLREALKEADHFEHILDITRRWTNDHKFRIGIQVLRGITDGIAAGPALTSVAETVIRVLVPAVENEFAAQHGRIAGAGMSAIAYGKLGGRELMHGSDLDLVFVYDHNHDLDVSDGKKPLAPSVYFMRLAQRIVSAISAPTGEGKLYEIDLRLRPSGNKGPIAVRLGGYFDYLKDSAWTWEYMALTRARPISGPPELQARIICGIEDLLTMARDADKLICDVDDMRTRMAGEHRGESIWDIKHHRGGLVDIEFITQYFQLALGRNDPALLSPTTMEALWKLSLASALSADDADVLMTALKLWQGLQSIIRLIGPERLDDGQPPAGQAHALCRVAGVETFVDLKHSVEEKAEAVRYTFTRLIEHPASELAEQL
ncbi:MAG: bifunctional [glutamine synthetase] adenylyltransferase/[glutamine synthetase]-adenylyl-L-tyrosine phosphorylase [Alphaproteobacteria bacterium]